MTTCTSIRGLWCLMFSSQMLHLRYLHPPGPPISDWWGQYHNVNNFLSGFNSGKTWWGRSHHWWRQLRCHPRKEGLRHGRTLDPRGCLWAPRCRQTVGHRVLQGRRRHHSNLHLLLHGRQAGNKGRFSLNFSINLKQKLQKL